MPVLIAAVLLAFPPFKIRNLAARPPASDAQRDFDAAANARKFWDARLSNAASVAHEVKELAAILNHEPGADARLGRRAGLGAEPVFIVLGTGSVIRSDARCVWLEVGDSTIEVVLRTTPLFGSCLRDAFESAEVASLSSFQAKALSSELNKIAEARVQPDLASMAEPHRQVSFVGCAQRRVLEDGRQSFIVVATSVEAAT